MNTIAVTGARGLLGSTLIRSLPGAIALDVDVRDGTAVGEAVQAMNPEWIIHTAAKTDVAACEGDPDTARAVNAFGTRHVVEAARAVGARLIYISTVSVFDGRTGNYREEDMPHAINVYNETKLEGERYVAAYDRALTIRLNLIGIHPEGSRGRSFVEWLVNEIQADHNLRLFTDVRINPLSSHTVARYIRTIIEKQLPCGSLLHIGSSNVLSKAEIGKMVAARFPAYRGTIEEVSVDTLTDGVARPKEIWLNTEKATTILGPMPLLGDEIDLIIPRS